MALNRFSCTTTRGLAAMALGILLSLAPLPGLRLTGIAAQTAAAPAAATAAGQPLPSSDAGGPAGPAVGTVAPAASPALTEARKTLVSVAPQALADKIEQLASTLPPAEALALIGENVTRVPSAASKSALFEHAASLALLLGRFPRAAELYSQESAQWPGGKPEALLRAARCELAAGEGEQARDLAASVLIGSPDSLTSARARLVGAWALYFLDRAAEARGMAQELASGAPGSAERREARFLLWVVSSGAEKSAAALRLATDFPDSPEALMATGKIAPAPFPHWYLGPSMAPDAAPGPGIAAPATQPAAASTGPPSAAAAAPAAASAAAAPQATRLQVGYFSVESNARGLAAELKTKGFTVGIEEHSPGTGAEGARRWIVYVEGGADPDAVRLKLKDAGYESYPLD